MGQDLKGDVGDTSVLVVTSLPAGKVDRCVVSMSVTSREELREVVDALGGITAARRDRGVTGTVLHFHATPVSVFVHLEGAEFEEPRAEPPMPLALAELYEEARANGHV